MTELEVCLVRVAVRAWMFAVDDDMRVYDPKFYDHLCEDMHTLVDDMKQRAGEFAVREMIQEAYAAHVGVQEVAV